MDVVLVDDEGRGLDMGSPLNEEGPLMRTDADGPPPLARKNRRALLRAMEGAGFVNYGHEWWHYSHGDRYWAHATGEPAARYGAV